jgi:hypothetical protein
MSSNYTRSYPMEFHRYLLDNRAIASCITCFNFKVEEEKCELAGQRPPAETIVVGCPQWDGCPF